MLYISMSITAEAITKVQFGDLSLLKLPLSIGATTCPEEFAGKPLFLGGMRKTRPVDFDKALKKYVKLLGGEYSGSTTSTLNVVDASSLPHSPMHLFDSSYSVTESSADPILDISLEDGAKICVNKLKITLSKASADKPEILILEILKINMPDTDIPISIIFPHATAFISEAFLKKQPLIIGCEMGISRSVSLLSAFLVEKLKMTICSPDGTSSPQDDDAIVYIKRQRSRACPNFYFETQLHKLFLENRKAIPQASAYSVLTP